MSSALQLPGGWSIAGFSHVYLCFDAWYQTHVVDGDATAAGIVQYSLNGGTTWTNLVPVGGYPQGVDYFDFGFTRGFGGDSQGWRTFAFRLHGWTDEEELALRFLYLTSDDDQGSLGWVIDNVYITPEPPALPPVEGLTIRKIGQDIVRIGWEENDADLYRIYRGPDPYGPMSFLAETNGSYYLDRDVLESNAVRMYYRVTAVLH